MFRSAALVAVSALLVLAGCGAGGDKSSDAEVYGADHLDDLVAAAKTEGTLVFYASDGEATTNAIVSAFTDQYGIDVQVTKIPSADVASRYQSEAAAGKVLADITNIECSGGEFMHKIVDEGWADPITKLGIPAFDDKDGAEQLLYDGAAFISTIHPAGIAYNTDKVDATELASWEDVIDPKFKGKIVMPDPGSAIYHVNFLAFLDEQFGDDFLTSIAAQKPEIAPSATARNQVTAGQQVLFFSTSGSATQASIEQGAPIDFALPPVTTGMSMCTTVSSAKQAPHPNAARLFAYFLTTEKGAKAAGSALDAMSPFTEAGLPDGYKPLPQPDAAEQKRLLDLVGLG